MNNRIIMLLVGVLLYKLSIAQITGEVRVNPNEITVSQKDGYDVIQWSKGRKYKTLVGSPDIPVLYQTYVLPFGVDVTNIDIEVNDMIDLEGQFLPYPQQQDVPTDNSLLATFNEPDSVYYSIGQFPTNAVEIVSSFNEMGYNLVTLCISPIIWNSGTHKISLRDIAFTINYDAVKGNVKKTMKGSLRRINLNRKVIKSMVENPEDVDNFYTAPLQESNMRTAINDPIPVDVISEQIPDYIIITNEELKPEFQRLADWKTQKGVPTLIKKIEDIKSGFQGADLSEKVHAYLRECYLKWGEGLFVLLGGDINVVPTRFYLHDNKEFPSDAYFADLECDWNSNRNHLFKEKIDNIKNERLCYVGRAPVEDSVEASIFVNKVLAYEQMNNNDINKQYLLNHLIASAFIGKKKSGFLYNGGQNSLFNYFKSIPSITNQWFLFDHYNCACSNHNPQTIVTNGEELNREHFLSALQNGGNSGLGYFHIVYHMDHSNPRCMGASVKDKCENIYVSDIDGLTNGDYQQIVISGGCKPAMFNYDCIAESFINNPNGGAVAFIGNANNGYSSECSLYLNVLKSLYNENISSLGFLKNQMIKNRDSINYRLHLLGDPEMPVWSNVPQNLDVVVTPDTIQACSAEISIQVCNLPESEEAVICLYKDPEVYTILTVNDTLPHILSVSPKIAGDLKVTITARNFIPFVKTINVRRSQESVLSIESARLYRGFVVSGGAANIATVLHNSGTRTASNVRGILSSSSPYIIMMNDTVTFGTIPAGTSKGSSDVFTFRISPDAPESSSRDWNAICFYLTMLKDGTDVEDIDTIKVDTKMTRTRIVSNTIYSTTDGDMIPEPNERVSVRIMKESLATNPDTMYLSVTSLVPYATVKSERIAMWSFNIDNSYVVGDPLTFKVVLYANNNPQDSTIVNVAETMSSLSSANIHTQCNNENIVLYWDKSTAVNNATMYNVYRCNTENGRYALQNQIPLTSRYYCDETVAPLTTYYYKISALTSSYLEGGMSPSVKASTTLPQMDMFPVSVETENYWYTNESNVGDFDYDGKKEIMMTGKSDAKGSVILVRYDGTAPYDIDENVTFFNEYSELPVKADATPVLADLLGNCEPCLLVPTRKSNTTNYLCCISSLDKNGDNLPDTLWNVPTNGPVYRSVVVSDIDFRDGKGEKEIIVKSEAANTDILVYDAYGQIKRNIGTGCFPNSFYGAISVADLDNDGDKEIICGSGNKIYVWRHDGTAYMRTPFYTCPNSRNLSSSIVVCDFDNDGEKEIIVSSRNNGEESMSYVYVIKQNSSCLNCFNGDSINSVSIPYTTERTSGIDHSVSVGDINKDGVLELVALGHNCVRIWNNNGDILLDKTVNGLFPNVSYSNNLTSPILADVSGNDTVDIVFHINNKVYAIDYHGNELGGFPLSAVDKIENGVCVSDIDNDGKNEIIAGDMGGYIHAWKTNGVSTAIEWGRSRFDTGFTGEYVSGYQDPWVVTENRDWQGGAFVNDIIVRSGTLRISSGKDLQMPDACRIYVMDGGTLEVDGGVITNANVLIKDGGKLKLTNGGTIRVSQYGEIETELGAEVEILSGEMLFNDIVAGLE